MEHGRSAARYYAKLAWAVGVPFGAAAALCTLAPVGLTKGWSEALRFGALTFVAAGAAFGIIMSLLMGTRALRATRDLGPGALEVRQHDEVAVPGDVTSVLTRVGVALRALPRAKDVRINETVATATARTGLTWWSFGERVTARVEARGEDACLVRVSSVPTSKTTLVDYGINRRNVMHVVASLDRPS